MAEKSDLQHPFGRAYELRLGDKVFTSVKNSKLPMDIKFDVTYGQAQACRQGTISILGLSWKTMSEFVKLTGMDQTAQHQANSRVALTCWYWDNPCSSAKRVSIFDGHCFDVSITPPPEIWLNMTVCEADPQGRIRISPNFSFNKDGYTAAGIAASVFRKFGYSFVNQYNVGLKKKVSQFYIGSNINISEAIYKCSQLADWDLTIRGQGTVEAYPKDFSIKRKGICYADEKHGLVGVSGVCGFNANVTTFLMEEHPGLCSLQVKSKMNPAADGLYTIMRKRYYGHYRGTEWYTEYQCAGKRMDESSK